MIYKFSKRIIRKYLYRLSNIKTDFVSDVMIPRSCIKKYAHPVSISRSTVMGASVQEGCKLNNVICYGDIKLGRFVSIFGPGTILNSMAASIYLGDFSSIGQNVSIQDSYHRFDKVSSYFMNRNLFGGDLLQDVSTKGDVVIGEDVWVGSNSVILSGIKIGRGSIVGAGSVVTKSVPPYSIVAGNPARIIKMRFSEEVIAALENSKWWTWPIEKIVSNKDIFLCDIRGNKAVFNNIMSLDNLSH